MAKEVKIQCPKCSWEPDGKPYWQCDCGHAWDTFQTAARCPACSKQHKLTQCIQHAGGCDQLSPHLDWYDGLDEWVKEEVESVVVEVVESFIPPLAAQDLLNFSLD